ncbi:MAG TPA: septum formation initiator [Holosporales bacterium]|nr:septum formation initiator [Holosporales bacterium]
MNRQYRYYLKKFFLPASSSILFIYFFWHILSGDHGWFSWRSLETELQDSRKILLVLEEEEKKLQNKVKLMRPKHLDRDLLDEKAREMLNVADDQDIVVIDDAIGS